MIEIHHELKMRLFLIKKRQYVTAMYQNVKLLKVWTIFPFVFS